MPIYAYKCASCGHQRDVLQKLSDPVLVDCPACGAPALVKQITAAGFQLKGSGWYVTDFKNGQAAAKKADDSKPADKAAGTAAEGSSDKPADKTPDKADAKSADTAAPAAAPAATPAAPPAGGDAAA